MKNDKGCKMVPLGTNSQIKIMEDKSPKKELSMEDRVATLEDKVADLRTLVTTLLQILKDSQGKDEPAEKKIMEKEVSEKPGIQHGGFVGTNQRLNKDMIPINSILTGIVNGVPHVLYVHRDSYTVGNKRYETLSGAAKGVTGKRRNGWEFWRTPDGTKIGDLVTIPIYANS